jgi:transcriptional regulator with XRE-family HTH domain
VNIGENIRKFRLNKGLTQKELAALVEVTVVTIQNYENNRRTPDFDMAVALTKALDCKLVDLFGEENSGETVKEQSSSYYLEMYLHTLGYDIIYDEEDGYLILKSENGTHEINQQDVSELENNARSFIEYKIHEIMKKSRKIGK